MLKQISIILAATALIACGEEEVGENNASTVETAQIVEAKQSAAHTLEEAEKAASELEAAAAEAIKVAETEQAQTNETLSKEPTTEEPATDVAPAAPTPSEAVAVDLAE